MDMLLLLAIALLALLIGTYTDLKTREVPDWLNFTLIASGLGIRLIQTAALGDSNYIYEGLFGFGLAFIVANGMYYSGQWGGGDAKMLMGLGAVLGFDLSFEGFFSGFLINILFVGAAYGLLWSSYLALKNLKAFRGSFNRIASQKDFLYARIAGLVACTICVVLFFVVSDRIEKFLITIVAVLIMAMLYLWVFVRAVEQSCMLRYIKPTQLTEGDWIAEDVIVQKKRIAGPKDLGVTKEQITQLQSIYKKGKLKKVLVKDGIPFVPSFLIAFFIVLMYGNLIIAVLRIS